MDQLQNPTETDTKMKIITPFLEELGWARSSTRVRTEYSPVDSIRQRPDYLLQDSSGDPRIVVEAKKWKKQLGKSERDQMKNYLRMHSLRLGILTNGFHYEFFKRDDISDISIDTPTKVTIAQLPVQAAFLQPFKPQENTDEETDDLIKDWRKGTVYSTYRDFIVESADDSIPARILLDVHNTVAKRNEKPTIGFQELWNGLYELGIDKENKCRARSESPDYSRETCLMGYRFTDAAIEHIDSEHRDHPDIRAQIESAETNDC